MHNSVGTEEELQYGLGALGTASLLVRRIRMAIEERQSEASPPKGDAPISKAEMAGEHSLATEEAVPGTGSE